MAAFPRVYSSFAEFERDELKKYDSLRTSVDDMMAEKFSEELNFEMSELPRRRRGRPRKNA